MNPRSHLLRYNVQELQTELAEGYKQMKLMGEFVEELQSTEPVKETRLLETQLADFKSVAKAGKRAD